MKKRRIIVCVDDDTSVLDSLERDLNGDYELELCESAEEALELRKELLNQGKTIDVYIIDQIMPGIKGIDFMRILNKEADSAQRMLLTAYADTVVASQGINEKLIDHYAEKPYDKDNLKQKINELLKARDRGTFVTKARTTEEKNQALYIQNKVFSEEHLGLPYEKGIKIIGESPYQDKTDMFVAISQRNMVGTTSLSRPETEYRKKFGTELGLPIEEFYDITNIAEWDHNLIQVRNATVLGAHRHKGVGPMIWGEIYRESRRSDPKPEYAIILAASEIREPKKAYALYKKIQMGEQYKDEWKINLLEKQYPQIYKDITKDDIEDAILPGLLEMYMHINFHFIGEPVYYENYQMFDFPMLLKIKDTKEPYKTWFQTGRL